MHWYNIHDIVRIKSEVLLHELEYFDSEAFDDPDLTVTVSNSIPGNFSFERHIFRPQPWNPRHIVYVEHLGSFGAKFSLNFSDIVEIAVNPLISKSRNVLYVNLVEPILRFIMVSKGYILLHSACVDLRGHGIILSAPPDTGKTTTVLKLVKSGYGFLSDDMTIINLPNNALCFPKPMTISAHTFQTVVDVSNVENKKSSLKLRSLVHSKGGRSFMHRLAKYNVPIFTLNTFGQLIIKPPKYDIRSILSNANFRNTTTVDSLYFLQRGGNECVTLETGSALASALSNSDDAFLFPPYQDLLDHIDIKGRSANALLVDEKRILKNFLASLNCFALKSDTRSWYKMIAAYAESRIK